MKPHKLWFRVPPMFVPWPRGWYSLYITYSVPAVRFLGYSYMDFDDGRAYLFGFWFFHLGLAR